MSNSPMTVVAIVTCLWALSKLEDRAIDREVTVLPPPAASPVGRGEAVIAGPHSTIVLAASVALVNEVVVDELDVEDSDAEEVSVVVTDVIL